VEGVEGREGNDVIVFSSLDSVVSWAWRWGVNLPGYQMGIATKRVGGTTNLQTACLFFFFLECNGREGERK
jgi:hypothetical protein